MARNVWAEDDFAKDYAEKSKSGGMLFECDVNESSLLNLVPSGAKTVLDYGCSSGHFANRLSEKYEVTGYDIAKSAREFAKKSFPNLRIIGEVTGKFNCVTLKLVLHLIPEPREFLAELTKHLTDNGSFVISIPHPVTYAEEYKIKYDVTEPFSFAKTEGSMGLLAPVVTYWRPLKYWVKLFRELGFTISEIDEPCKDEKLLPKRFNARLEKIK